MEPRIQYAKTEDGVSIAYWTLGEGTPFVCMPGAVFSHVLDLEAVVDRVGLEKFALLAYFTLGQVAIAYAVRHPERVSRLLLWCSYARAPTSTGRRKFKD